MRRGELAQRSGCNIETVRFYEKRGLLQPPPRTGGGHRDYAPEHLRRLTFIRRSRELGFTLDQVRSLLGLVDGGEWTCAEVRAMTVEHSAQVRRKIADLEKLAQVLDDMAAQCDGGALPECPIIDALLEST
ncbi:MAG TPA: helix-turn-helix domain-containing protein [Geminicoccaceae bacterium]|jgi:MerR family mercuric resistance operon transcriptional regulator|nr:helix-turn-helix domain-containing protein [Geminicoccaceae bacterium]